MTPRILDSISSVAGSIYGFKTRNLQGWTVLWEDDFNSSRFYRQPCPYYPGTEKEVETLAD